VNVLCVIPALDAAASVARVIEAVRREIPGVIVLGVDDGSVDDTRVVLRRKCDRVLTFDVNRGKGAALRAAFNVAREEIERGAIDAVLTIDADGQHDASFAPELLRALEKTDIAIGTRDISAVSVPPHRRLANRLSTAACRAVTGSALRDSQSGYRAMRARVVQSIDGHGDRYEFETDFLVRAMHAGFTVSEVIVPTIYGPPSHFRELRDAWRVARVLWSHRAGVFRS
jgi:glycosyltransferase involved in cell wall biosynthesis